MKIVKIVISVVAIVVLFWLYNMYSWLETFEPILTQVELHSTTSDDILYIKRKVWGITGDHSIIVVSNSAEEDFKPDIDREYVYRDYHFFYRFENDTLTLYVSQASPVPTSLETHIAVIQTVLDSSELAAMRRRYRNNLTTGIKMIE